MIWKIFYDEKVLVNGNGSIESEVTSKDTIISSGSIFCWHMKVENALELWVCWSFIFPIRF